MADPEQEWDEFFSCCFCLQPIMDFQIQGFAYIVEGPYHEAQLYLPFHDGCDIKLSGFKTESLVNLVMGCNEDELPIILNRVLDCSNVSGVFKWAGRINELTGVLMLLQEMRLSVLREKQEELEKMMMGGKKECFH